MKHKRKNIVRDTWLSETLGRPVYRVVVDAALVNGTAQARLERARVRRMLRTRSVFAYSRVHSGDLEAATFLQDLGFRLVDTNLVFEKPLDQRRRAIGRYKARFAESADESQTVALAGRAFTFSRFHMDPRIGRRAADRLKAEWVRNYFRGRRGDAMVVALVGGKVAAFLLLLRSDDAAFVIDLIAVDRRFRGRGIAAAMIAFAETHCRGAKRIRAGTQIANMPSIRMYERLGFRVSDADYLFHYHKH
ncbi:MAG: GNAT family N-acetyltransferase [Planctomycetota bacterium]|nr:GNAT family N-acetyltransferase [Planctomycetota bacterium]